MTTGTPPKAGPPPSAMLMQLLFGGLVQQSVRVVAELGVADLVAERPVAIAELAARTNAHEASLYRVLRALAAIGVFEEHPGRVFGMTPVSALLQSDAPDSMRDFAMMQGADWNWRSLSELAHCIQTGGTGQAKAHGKELFEFLTEHPEDQALFDRAMTSYTASALAPIVEAYS